MRQRYVWMKHKVYDLFSYKYISMNYVGSEFAPLYFKANTGFQWASCPTRSELSVLHIFGFICQFLANKTLHA